MTKDDLIEWVLLLEELGFSESDAIEYLFRNANLSDMHPPEKMN